VSILKLHQALTGPEPNRLIIRRPRVSAPACAVPCILGRISGSLYSAHLVLMEEMLALPGQHDPDAGGCMADDGNRRDTYWARSRVGPTIVSISLLTGWVGHLRVPGSPA